MDTAPDPLGLIGTTIAEKYAVESVVGEGGFAIVYRATHTLWKRPVAVKVFKALGEVNPAERQRLLDDFIQEGRLLADLSERSTAICQARDVGMTTTPGGDVVPYMVLEWLEGKPLDSVLEGERTAGMPLRSLEETVRLLDPVAEALALAHKKGIAHRDVKPANVFVLGDPRGADRGVKLLDFGIAKVVQDAQKMGFGKTAGHITSFTPSYGAPEQFNRTYGATGPWTDVFALALLAVEVMSGQEPLAGDSLVQLAYAASDPGVRPVPRTYGVRTSDEVHATFLKAVAVKPEDRYPTAGDFWNALRTAAVGQPLSTMTTGSSVRVAAAPAAGPPSSGRGAPDPAQGATLLQPAAADLAVTAAAPASAPVASAAAPGLGLPAATSSPAPSTPAGKKSSGLVFAVVGVAALVGIGGAALALRAGSGGGGNAGSAGSVSTLSAPTIASGVPSAKASTGGSGAAAGPLTCPKGTKPIRGGEFFMGSDEKDAEKDEKPPHRVRLAGYCLDEFEVTVAQYKECSDNGGCLRAGRENEWKGITAAQRRIYDPLCNINDADKKKDHPINCVDWEQARTYCEANGGRLPTEAEWEFAARGSDGRIYPWGDSAPSVEHLNACGKECTAWMGHPKNRDPEQPILAMHSGDDGFIHTAPVGKFPKGASGSGIQDIVGNVSEWVADWYGPYDAASATVVGTNPTGPATGTERVVRGGAWNAGVAAWVRPAWRFNAMPTMRTHGIGFRCVRSVAGTSPDAGASK